MGYVLLAGLPFLASVGEEAPCLETWNVSLGAGMSSGPTAQKRRGGGGEKDCGRGLLRKRQ